MTTRRILALVLILCTGLARFETVWGEVRDGEVHHENAIAAAHAAEFQGEHGHEDAGAPEHRHDEGHEHGTSSDHCTHQHGPALVTTATFFFEANVELQISTESHQAVDWIPVGLFHPPRA